MTGSIDSIETLGLVDGPGIRCVVFMNGCKLRCKYCHNPEMWLKKESNFTVDELVNKLLRYKPYFKDNGGVTFSGGEPLLQSEFLIEVMKKLKDKGIHICLDTAGVGNHNYEEIVSLTDLVLLDIKHINAHGFTDLTGGSISDSEEFIEEINKQNKPVWIRQVIVPGIMDNDEYLYSLADYLKRVKNIERIDFLPYHKMGDEKYKKLNIRNPLDGVEAMDKEKCNELYKKFMLIYNRK